MDELEESFHSTILLLSGNQSLEDFQKEYLLLHNNLQIEIENNKALVERIRLLNNEISSNASKVASVLNMSQNDQRTIVSLRIEFDKA